MSENWKYQLSIKINAHMLNLRADTGEEFLNMLKEATETYAEPIELACERLGGVIAPPTPAPAPTPAGRPSWRPRATSQAVPLGETGPVQILGVGVETTTRDGLPLNNPKHVVRFSDGKTLSTFDASIGQAASTLQGQPVFYRSEQRGKWTNLAGVRRAG